MTTAIMATIATIQINGSNRSRLACMAAAVGTSGRAMVFDGDTTTIILFFNELIAAAGEAAAAAIDC